VLVAKSQLRLFLRQRAIHGVEAKGKVGGNLIPPKEEARDEDLSQSHGAKLRIEAWSQGRRERERERERKVKYASCVEHSHGSSNAEDMMQQKLFLSPLARWI
jgi:hypothetical protein